MLKKEIDEYLRTQKNGVQKSEEYDLHKGGGFPTWVPNIHPLYKKPSSLAIFIFLNIWF